MARGKVKNGEKSPWVSEDGNNLARVAGEEQNGPGLWEVAGESGSDSAKTAC